jgi:hypothetical protein
LTLIQCVHRPRRGIGRGRSRPARRVQQISLLADAPTDDPSWFSACSTAIGGGLRRRARERRRRRAAPLHHVCVSSVASVENTTSPSCSADRTASLGGTAQYGRKRPSRNNSISSKRSKRACGVLATA